MRVKFAGRPRFGELLDVGTGPVSLQGHRTHLTLDWEYQEVRCCLLRQGFLQAEALDSTFLPEANRVTLLASEIPPEPLTPLLGTRVKALLGLPFGLLSSSLDLLPPPSLGPAMQLTEPGLSGVPLLVCLPGGLFFLGRGRTGLTLSQLFRNGSWTFQATTCSTCWINDLLTLRQLLKRWSGTAGTSTVQDGLIGFLLRP